MSKLNRYLVALTFEAPEQVGELGDVLVYAGDEAQAEEKAHRILISELTATVKGRVADDVPDKFYERVIW